MRHLFSFFLLSVICSVGTSFTQIQRVSAQSQQYSCTNLAATPDYVKSRSASDAIAAINTARQQERLHRLQLPGNFYQLSPVQQQFLLVNAERIDRGLQPLLLDSTLSQMAQNYAQQMATQHFFGHTSPSGVTFVQRINSNPAVRNHFSTAGENLAANPVAGVGPIYEYMYDDATSGCGHRINILTPSMTHMGIGVANSDIYGSISVQDFIASASWNPYHNQLKQNNMQFPNCLYEEQEAN